MFLMCLPLHPSASLIRLDPAGRGSSRSGATTLPGSWTAMSTPGLSQLTGKKEYIQPCAPKNVNWPNILLMPSPTVANLARFATAPCSNSFLRF